MSLEAVMWAYNLQLEPGPKSVLVALATYADIEGLCYPGHTRLMEMTGYANSTVRQYLNDLEEQKLLRRTPRWREDGGRSSDTYQLRIDPPPPPGRGARRHPAPPPPPPGGDLIRDLKDLNKPPIVPQGGPTSALGLKLSQPEPEKTEPVTPEDLMEGWNELVVPSGPSKCLALTPTRRRKCLLRLKEHPDLAFWETVMNAIPYSTFLRGLSQPTKEHPKPFRANFDWLIDNDVNVMKIYEGRYS